MEKEIFVMRAQQIHDRKYNYELLPEEVPTDGRHKVKILCQEHGLFEQTPNHHLYRRHGCPKCKGAVLALHFTKPASDFLEQAKTVHNNLYDYSEIEYKGAFKKIKILCPKHGPFYQTPDNHLNGKRKCPRCSRMISKTSQVWLDSLGLNLLREHPIKIENRRFVVDGFDPKTNTIYEFLGSFWHGNPKLYDPKDINPRTKCSYGELYNSTFNRIRALEDAKYKVIFKWED